jgi:reductive dehalogenase
MITDKLHKIRPTSRVDERDTMFARMARRKGTQPYADYYAHRPELQRIDDHTRKLPRLCDPGGRFYHPTVSAQADQHFRDIGSIQPETKMIVDLAARYRTSSDPTATVKDIVLSLGGVGAGCTDLDEVFLYSHKGRFDDDYGTPVDLKHPYVIVFLVEMDFDEMQSAPRAEALRESAREYFRAAVISKTLTAVLQECGFEAKSHHDAHYDVILPALAVRAGLGELGRNNILIADKYGSRVRIGAVTTTMPLRPDDPVDLGADHFCGVCKKCAQNCPSNALSMAAKVPVRGVLKWPTNVERCYSYWRSAGSDCGICMAVCPFSHRNTRFHKLIRWIVRRAPWSHSVARVLDDLIYGNQWSTSTVDQFSLPSDQ